MARYDTTRRHASAKPRCGLIKHVLLVMIGFAFGYMTATFFNWSELLVWINTHIFIQKSPQATLVSKKAEIPKPKFEFYTLLTQESRASAVSGPATSVQKEEASHVVTSSPTPSASQPLSIDIDLAAPPQTNIALQEQKAIEKTLTQVKSGYWVQLASFRRAQDAEKMKANLSLRGVMTTIVSATQEHTQWFRVVLGPFANKFDAERAKKSVMLSVRIQGIVRKMDA